MPTARRPAAKAALLCASLCALPAPAADSPWRLADALGLGGGFSIEGAHRTRFETIADSAQPGASPSDQVAALRTTLAARWRSGRFSALVELADMRQRLADADTVIKGSTVNPADILQASVGYRFGNTSVRVGRVTQAWGSRRLLSRNAFRNTIQPFDGIAALHRDARGREFRFLASRVVRLLPAGAAAPAANRAALENRRRADRSGEGLRLHGVHASLPDFPGGLAAEFYLFALREKDTPEAATPDRRLDTFGFRLRSPRAPGRYDLELETIAQTGRRRASAAAGDRADLDHRAFFQYLGLGYSFDAPSRLRLQLELHYASGDADPLDGDSGRFDSLFGPTSGEFGVVGLYDPYNRSNLFTPGLRLSAELSPTLDVMASYRHFRLAQAKDSWGRTGLRDPSGESGRYLGRHLQLNLRWDALPGNVLVESGLILARTASLSDRSPRYFYVSSTLSF